MRLRFKKEICLFLISGFIFCNLDYLSYAEDTTNQPINEPTNQQANGSAELISLDYKDAQLSSVLRSLSYSYHLNLIATKDITGKVTVTLQNVTLEEALHAILDVNGYTFTRKGKLIYITPGPGLEGIGIVTTAIPLKYLIASDAGALLQKAISTKGDIRMNEATNSLVVTDYASNIDKIKSVLQEIDVQPIQVLIEAKLVDITEKDFQNFGLSYTADYKPVGDNKGLFDRNTATQEELAGAGNFAGPSSALTGGQLKITNLTLEEILGTVTLDALIQDNKAHLLASPSITTLNGKEARIIIGERFPYKEKTQTTTGTIETTKFVEIGTTLRVTPRVSPDGWITMSVHPEVSSLTSSLDAGPRVATREADATIRVKDGQTIIIGGLIKRQDDRVHGRLPLLGYVPILGWFFSKSSTDLQSTELVVFITPRVLRNPEEMEKVELLRKKEAVVSIEGVGERALADKLWDEGIDLQKNMGIESLRKDKDTRMSDALEHFRLLASQFPGSEKADDALYRAGNIAYDYFSDMDLAKKLFSQLIERCPNSPFIEKSKKMIAKIDKKIADKERMMKKKEKEPGSGNVGNNKGIIVGIEK
ncbi:MAG: secretin and TonB N-terminal domain-containing protein, partial [Candidatus Omnitrophica bacterium]|nr:secretin and TonB N-terminal domain-containing protein [Candidatus Omnitrophota bacterium]